MARAGMPMRAASANRSSTRAAPSSIEYSVYTWRCAKLPGMTAVALLPKGAENRWTGVSHRLWTKYTDVIPARSVHPGRPGGNDPRMSEIVAPQRFGANGQVSDL